MAKKIRCYAEVFVDAYGERIMFDFGGQGILMEYDPKDGKNIVSVYSGLEDDYCKIFMDCWFRSTFFRGQEDQIQLVELKQADFEKTTYIATEFRRFAREGEKNRLVAMLKFLFSKQFKLYSH